MGSSGALIVGVKLGGAVLIQKLDEGCKLWVKSLSLILPIFHESFLLPSSFYYLGDGSYILLQ